MDEWESKEREENDIRQGVRMKKKLGRMKDTGKMHARK